MTGAAPQSHTNRPPVSGVVVPHKPTGIQRFLGFVIFALIRAVATTVRFRFDNQSGFPDERIPVPVVFALWHNRLVLSAVAYRRFGKPSRPNPRLAAMVSASKDGGFLSAILECFRIQPVRGSTSRRGRQALLELTSWAESGYDLAITPDGPRGPRYVVQDGVTSLGQLTGLPILPFTYNLNWKIQLRSWDRFQIPLPFARCDMRLGPPIHVPREATDEQREALRRQLEQSLQNLSQD